MHIQDDKIRDLAGLQTAGPRIGKGRHGGPHRSGTQRIDQGQAKPRVQRVERLGLAGTSPRGGRIQVLQRAVRRGGRVGAEGQVGAVLEEVAVGECAAAAGGAQEVRPGAADGRVGVHGLHGRGDAQIAQSAGVVGVGEFEMFDAVAVAAAAVAQGFQRGDGHAHRGVADGVQGALQPGGVGVGHDATQHRLGPDRCTVAVGWVGVGFQQRRRAGVDDAVADELDAGDAEVRRRREVVLAVHGDGSVHLGEVLSVGFPRFDNPVRREAYRYSIFLFS